MSNQIEKSEQKSTFVSQLLTALSDNYSLWKVGETLSEHEKTLALTYIEGISNILANPKKPYTWEQVNLKKLLPNLAAFAKLGLDWSIPNTLSAIPFWNKELGKVDLVLIKGVEAYKHITNKFAVDPPLYYRVELVHKNDTFKIVKGNAENGDDYQFEITNPFDRGEIIGGFGYLGYEDSRKNVLLPMSEAEILKYRPQYFDKTFWVTWKEKMYTKTIAKNLFKNIALDPDKIKGYATAFDIIETSESMEFSNNMAKAEIEEKQGQGNLIDIPDEVEEIETENKDTHTQHEQATEHVEAELIENIKEHKTKANNVNSDVVDVDILQDDFLNDILTEKD